MSNHPWIGRDFRIGWCAAITSLRLSLLVSRRSHGIRHSCHGSATGETRGRNYARNAESWRERKSAWVAFWFRAWHFDADPPPSARLRLISRVKSSKTEGGCFTDRWENYAFAALRERTWRGIKFEVEEFSSYILFRRFRNRVSCFYFIYLFVVVVSRCDYNILQWI